MENKINKHKRIDKNSLIYCSNCDKPTHRIYIGIDRVCKECRHID